MWHDRKLHGNVNLHDKKNAYLRILVITCDPNLSFLKRIKKWIGVWIEYPLKFPLEMIKLVPKIPLIIKSKCKEKKKQSSWL